MPFSNKLASYLRRPIFVYATGLLVLSLVCLLAFLFWYQENQPPLAKASSINFGGGTISLEKKYLLGATEVSSLSATQGEIITVRLKYDNTAGSSASEVQITDSLPTQFQYVPGSLRNCYVDAQCVDLPDTLFDNQSLQVAPGAGYFGINPTAADSILEIGKKLYLDLHQCEYRDTNLGDITGLIATANDIQTGTGATNTQQNVQCTGNLNNLQTGSFSGTGNQRLLLTGQRYLHLHQCEYQNTDTDSRQYLVNIPGSITSQTGTKSSNLAQDNHACLNTYGDQTKVNGRDGQQALDILGQRYLHLHQCQVLQNSNDHLTYFLNLPESPLRTGTSANNSPTQTLSCTNQTSAVGINNQASSVQHIDLLDNSRGYGYIEYQMLTPTIDGQYGSPASMTGSFSAGSLISGTTTDISISGLTCDYLQPESRTLDLSDAELRTDQDFTCNYDAQMCTAVFLDANENGQKEPEEVTLPGLNVQLYNTLTNQLIYTLSSSDTGNICFDPLRHGTNYRMTVSNPPSPYSTTGGDDHTFFVTYNSGIQEHLFGYTSGSLQLSVPELVTFSSLYVAPIPTQSSTVIPQIQVTDTRLGMPGWVVTARIDNLSSTLDPQIQIPVGNKFTFTPGTIFIDNGQANGLLPGSSRQVTSTADQATIFSASSGSGQGRYTASTSGTVEVPPYSQAHIYQTTITFSIA